MNELSLNTCGRCGAAPMVPHDPGCHTPCVLRDNRYRAQIQDLVDLLCDLQDEIESGVGGGHAFCDASDFMSNNHLKRSAK